MPQPLDIIMGPTPICDASYHDLSHIHCYVTVKLVLVCVMVWTTKQRTKQPAQEAGLTPVCTRTPPRESEATTA